MIVLPAAAPEREREREREGGREGGREGTRKRNGFRLLFFDTVSRADDAHLSMPQAGMVAELWLLAQMYMALGPISKYTR
jgi:hypothetical protein